MRLLDSDWKWRFGNLTPTCSGPFIPVQRKSWFPVNSLLMIRPNHTFNSAAVVSLQPLRLIPIPGWLEIDFRFSCHIPLPFATFSRFREAYRFVFTASSSNISGVKNNENKDSGSFPHPSGRLTYTSGHILEFTAYSSFIRERNSPTFAVCSG